MAADQPEYMGMSRDRYLLQAQMLRQTARRMDALPRNAATLKWLRTSGNDLI